MAVKWVDETAAL
jgi:hypothetical protein